MTHDESLLLAIKKSVAATHDASAFEDYLSAMVQLGKTDKRLSYEYCEWVKRESSLALREADSRSAGRLHDVLKKSYYYMARDDFDSFCIYIEMNREHDKRFYQPRRRGLRQVTHSLQKLADDELDLLAISLPPGVGKTSLAIFFLCWLAGREPNKPILGGSHSNAFLRGVYDECLRIVDPKGEYLWHDVFPEVKVSKTNAQDLMIDFDKPQRFGTLEFSSIGSGNAGKVRAETLLYCDDLCSGIEEALSRERMDSLWTKYSTDLRQRKIGKCKELHIATRWSVHDVIGRLEREYSGSDRAKFLVMPAVNERGESNFDYGNAVGFTTEFYKDMQRTLDDASWRALYMNEPIEREGLLYHESELRRYFDLPEGDDGNTLAPDAIISVCDPKEKGTDYWFMPIVYVYGTDYYVEDCICDNSGIETLDVRAVDLLARRNAHSCQVESNSAGWRTAEKMQNELKNRGARTHITTKRTTTNKETKIIVNAAWVKEHCLFKDHGMFAHGTDYWRMMNFLCSYTMAGKNKNDDVPDGMAMLAEYAQNMSGAKVQVLKRTF